MVLVTFIIKIWNRHQNVEIITKIEEVYHQIFKKYNAPSEFEEIRNSKVLQNFSIESVLIILKRYQMKIMCSWHILEPYNINEMRKSNDIFIQFQSSPKVCSPLILAPPKSPLWARITKINKNFDFYPYSSFHFPTCTRSNNKQCLAPKMRVVVT